MRLAIALLLATATAAAPAPAPTEYVQAVEFPYYLYPRAQWERELVWLKAIGIRTIEFSTPWNWHRVEPGRYDLTGATSPRRDLVGLVRILRRLELRAWVRPLPPVPDWPSPQPDAAEQDAWLKQLERLLATQTVSHGGPVAFTQTPLPGVDAAPPPAPSAEISVLDPKALAQSRDGLAHGQKAVVWRNVEDAVYPAGWEPDGSPLLRKGAVGITGEEQPASGALRRQAALLRNWGALLSDMRPATLPKPASGAFPEAVTAYELSSPAASAVAITNGGAAAFHDELRVFEPSSKRTLVIPNVAVPAGESLWLPVNVSIGPGGLCRECSHFAPAERIVYATAELLSIEFENGILAMEFAAPEEGEAILQLAREPVGPYLAGGKPMSFDWDDKALRARLRIPAGSGPGRRVRIGIAIEEPETSGFFNEARRLIIGQKNTISTTYSAKDVASRSRLRVPEGFTVTSRPKNANEIDYDITVPPDELHGDWAPLALEADGMLLGRARLQMFRPLSVRLAQAIQVHFGETPLAVEPPTAPIDPRGGSNLELALRNNYPGIQTFHIEAVGDGLEFLPAKTEISIGATDERLLSLRVFAKEGISGLKHWSLKVSGAAANFETPMRVLIVPRGRSVAWSADLDGDGYPEWVLESQKARAVFSTRDGGRWSEFTWKDGGVNFLPDTGLFAAPGDVDAHGDSGALVITGNGWRRTVTLAEGEVTVEQTTPLPPDGLALQKRGNIAFSVERPAPGKLVCRLGQ